jgi:hypothetical protein
VIRLRQGLNHVSPGTTETASRPVALEAFILMAQKDIETHEPQPVRG